MPLFHHQEFLLGIKVLTQDKVAKKASRKDEEVGLVGS